MAEKEGTRQDGQFICISLTPDVCKTPTAPVPYPIVANFTNSIRLSPNVNFRGFPVFTMNSRLSTVTGDDAGVGGGVMSNVHKGFCRPISHNPTVRVNGHFVVYHQDSYMEMNCAGPEGPHNTIGQVQFTGPMHAVDVPPSGMVPNCFPDINAETDAEGGMLGSLLDPVGGIEGLVQMGQQAYNMATTDWSNPGAVLGAIGGVAGMAGMKQMAEYAGYAQQGYSLATTDFSNPGAVMGATMGIAGPILKQSENESKLPPGVILN